MKINSIDKLEDDRDKALLYCKLNEYALSPKTYPLTSVVNELPDHLKLTYLAAVEEYIKAKGN